MAPPKKHAIKMDLNSFLNDESFGESWADDQVDLNNINLPMQNLASSNTIPLEQLTSSKAGHLDGALFSNRKECVDYPIPDEPPFRIRISNLPWDVSEEGIQAWTEDNIEKAGSVLKVVAPKDRESDRLRGWAFVTFEKRENLVKALSLNASKLNDRTVYVSVAAPRDMAGEDVNWGAARGCNFQASNPELDWGVVRGSNFKEKKPKKADPDLDWGAVRGSNFESKERKPKREDPQLDWGAARGSNFHVSERKPRKEPNLDWDAARNNKPKFNFTRRSEAVVASTVKEETPKIRKSAYHVLHIESDNEDNDTEGLPKNELESKAAVADLERKTAGLCVEEDEKWETVGQN